MQLIRRDFYRLFAGLVWAPAAEPRDLGGAVHGAALYTDWKTGSGQWTDAARWSTGLPNAFKIASVDGNSRVVIRRGAYAAGLLNVGSRPGGQAQVEMNGGQLLVRQDSLIIGDRTNSQGLFILNDGAFYDAMDVFVGGPTAATGRMNKSALIVRGGTFVALTLTMGEGLGANSSISIEGSRATAISALEFVSILASADPSGKPGVSTLSFTLDEHGVTPISIQSRWWGLRIRHDRQSRCYLRIGLSAVPPREDVTLVTSLWNVNDASTAELMRLFYEAMETEGLPPDKALQRAQLTMSREERWASPYYWAGFIMEGDWATARAN